MENYVAYGAIALIVAGLILARTMITEKQPQDDYTIMLASLLSMLIGIFWPILLIIVLVQFTAKLFLMAYKWRSWQRQKPEVPDGR